METAAELVEAHRKQPSLIKATVERSLARLAAADDPAIFIHVADTADLMARAEALAKGPRDLPLFGVPVAVKDNIDVAGMPTTAACPAFSYVPERHAEAVARLERAGAIMIGKTNLDQFATGLVGTRSPYGTPRNPFRADLVPGGSSSGSAVAVARGIVALSLGTDTAGSGRVPAGLNNIVGLKPTCGLLPASGVVPACRSLDCVSIFALTVADAWCALEVMAGPDANDPYARSFDVTLPSWPPTQQRIGVPRQEDRIFFDDAAARQSFETTIERLTTLGATLVEIDISFLLDAAKLLYEGPWLAERAAAVGAFMRTHSNAVHPVTRSIVEKGWAPTAVDAFKGQYRLMDLRARTARLFQDIEAIVVPTAPTAYTLADLAADPIGPNSRLGTYTNFVNLMDLAGIAVPSTYGPDGVPRGVTLLVPAGKDARAARLAAALHAAAGLAPGCELSVPPLDPVLHTPTGPTIDLAVVGAHMTGLPLNGELLACGARFVAKSRTVPDYRFFSLPGTVPPKPGLLRVEPGAGHAIELEVWSLPVAAFGGFVAGVPSPLVIGTVRLEDGRAVKGFLVESQAVAGARDISTFGGWRAFLSS